MKKKIDFVLLELQLDDDQQQYWSVGTTSSSSK